MKVLFLLKNTGMHERLGIMILSAQLKKTGHEVGLLITEELPIKDLILRVASFKPEIIACSVMTGDHTYYFDLINILKKSFSFFSVFGGPHPTFLPEETIHQEQVDAICIGEADFAFPELVNRIQNKQNYYNLENFWFKKDGQVIQNPMGALTVDLDKIPFPDRELIYSADPALNRSEMKVFMTQRGCPHQCTYCFNSRYNMMTKNLGPVLRYRSVDNVIAEIIEVKKKHHLKMVTFGDDCFPMKPKGWLEEFALRFPKEVGLPFMCSTRANIFTDPVAAMLKKAGCVSVWMGIECGNEKVANSILKRNLTNEHIITAAALFHKYKIAFFTQNLTGLPVPDPLAIDLETLDLNIKINPTFAWSSILYPYPNTPIANYCIEHHFFNGNYKDIHVSNKTFSALDFKNKKMKMKIENLHKLFGIIVRYPILRPMTHFLISIPIPKLYTLVFFVFFGYQYVWKNLSFTGKLKNFFGLFSFFLKYTSRLEKSADMSPSPD